MTGSTDSVSSGLRRLVRSPVAIGVLAVLLGVVVSVKLLVENDWDASALTAFGEEDAATRDYAEEKLGREVVTRSGPGHDGRFFFVQANDPLLIDPEENAGILDRPAYRSQRMLYPLVAGGVGLADPELILWGLYVVNLLALGVGSWAVAHIARLHGLPTWAGLAFGLNIGLIFELYIDGAGVVAFALASLGALALERAQQGLAAAWFVAAALSREVMLVFVGSIWLFWWLRKRERIWRIAIPAGLAVVGWALYIRIQLGAASDQLQIQEISLYPLRGLWQGLTTGLAEPIDLVVMAVMVVLIVLIPFRSLSSPVYLTWGAVGFAVLAPFLTVFVWQKSFDISRALAPLVTAFVIELLLARQRRLAPGIGEAARPV